MAAKLNRHELAQSLCGIGVDIGPLHDPVPVNKAYARSFFVDRLTPRLLKEHYAGMVEHGLVDPHVVCDGGAELAFKPDSLDFIIGCHLLEHLPDPIGAVLAWHRALRPSGALLAVVPDPKICPDRAREVTSLEHLAADHEDPSSERDRAHFLEWSRYWNECQTQQEIEERAQYLIGWEYAIHYHVWLADTLRGIFAHANRHYGTRWDEVIIPGEPNEDGYVGIWRKRAGSGSLPGLPPRRDLDRTTIWELIGCPACKGELWQDWPWLVCDKCRKWYPTEGGIPVLLSSQAYPARPAVVPTKAMRVAWGGALELIDFEVTPCGGGGDHYQVLVRWKCLKAVETNWAQLMHLVPTNRAALPTLGEQQAGLANWDRQIEPPTSTWQPGNTYATATRGALPKLGGPWTVRLGMAELLENRLGGKIRSVPLTAADGARRLDGMQGVALTTIE